MSFERAAFFVLGVAALVYVVRLNDPPASYQQPGDRVEYVHDECYQAFTAHRYAIGDRAAWDPYATRRDWAAVDTSDLSQFTAYEWVHPPTAKLVMAAFIKLFGFQPTAYRLGSVLFGLLTLFLTWQLALKMRGAEFGLLALGLLATDGLVFTMSRIAMNDIYVTACSVGFMYAVYRYWTEDSLEWLAGAGVIFGVGLTMKWSIFPLWFGVACLVLGRLVYEAVIGLPPVEPPADAEKKSESPKRSKKHDAKKKKKRAQKRRYLRGRRLALAAAAFVGGWLIAPPIIYLASYIPYFAQGYGWDDFKRLNQQIWWYNQNLKATHSQSSLWWEWPLITRPVWFFAHWAQDGIRVIYAMGNPVLWWAFLPSLVWVAIRFARKREAADGLILCGFCGPWLPWMFVSRVSFLQYLLPAVPFGALAVATTLRDLGNLLGGERRRWLIGTYASIAVAVFINFYPFWSGYPISRQAFSGHRYFWFEKWRK